MAYDDSKGITRQFHKNLLFRINRELEGSFDPDLFTYRCIYDSKINAIQSYLVSSIDQRVHIKGLDSDIYFEKGEMIHTESSYKYRESDIDKMAQSTGFERIKNLKDSRRFFVDSLWQVKK